MRVLTVGNSFPPQDFGGGYEAVWEGAVRYLEERGHAIRVLTVDLIREPGLAEIADTHRELRWYWHDHGFPPRPVRESLAIERHNIAVLNRHVGDFDPDVLSWWSMGGLSMSMLEVTRRHRLPAVAFVHDDWLDYGRRADAWHRRARRRRYPPQLLERLLRMPGRIDFDGAAHYAFVSDATRAHALRRGLDLTDTSVIPSGIGSQFTPAPESPWQGRLLYVGRVDPRKGVSTVIEALAGLPDATLRVVGDGPPDHFDALAQLASSIGVTDRVAFDGQCEPGELPAVYASADVVVFPVVWKEPWGLVPLEAMASGRPVVATGRGGSGEYLVHGENALLYPAENVPELVDRVQRLARDAALRATLVRGGLATAEHQTAHRFNERVERALTSAVGG